MWRKYREFGGGYMTDWGAHMFDIVQWALGMDNSGPADIIPPDGKEFKTLHYKYKNGITVKHEDFGRGNAVRFIGSKGKIDVSRSFLEATPENILQQQLEASEIHLYKSVNHHQDWLDCIKSRNKPICDVEIGHRTATMCNIGNIAYELKRPLKWNPKKEKFKKDKEANSMLARKMREPYSYTKNLIV
jgi:predicted dehydrogenase